MAWTYEQKFNELNNGDLNGQDNWAGDADWDVTEDAAARYEGSKGLKVVGDDNVNHNIKNESIGSFSSGLFYVAVKKTNNSAWYQYIYLYEGAAAKCQIGLFSDSKIKIYLDGGWVEVVSYSANQWYVLAIEFDGATNKFRAKAHNGTSWSEWTDWGAGFATFTNISSLIFEFKDQGTTQTAYYDTITPTNPVIIAKPKSQGHLL